MILIIGVMFHSVVQEIVASLHQTYQPFIAHVRRAKNAKALLDGDYVDDFAKVSIPDLAAGFGDDGKAYTGSVDHGIAELSNGDLLMTMYGSFHGDNVPIPYFHHGTMQYRTWAAFPKDRGRSWSYLATVASPETSPLPAGGGLLRARLDGPERQGPADRDAERRAPHPAGHHGLVHAALRECFP